MQRLHAANRTTNNCMKPLDTERIKDLRLRSDYVGDTNQRELFTVRSGR